jgi:hypothetical protein
MKATFLIALPRCGSLALSELMNTDVCLTHHEGNDFNNVGCGNQLKFENTYAYKVFSKAIDEGKDYFCCDTSLGADLFRSFTYYIAEKKLTKAIKAQALFIRLAPSFVVKSIGRNNIDGFNKDTMMYTMLAIEDEVLNCAETLYHCGWFETKQAVIIEKTQESEDGTSLRFTATQLTEIAVFTGAADILTEHSLDIINQLEDIIKKAKEPISMTSEQLQRNINEVEVVFKKRMEFAKESNN